MKVLAPAKVNLYLDIVGLKKNGYHEIETLFQTISLCDVLDVREAPGQYAPVSLRVVRADGSSADCPCDERNIVWKAAALFLEQFGLDKRLKIVLTKNVPIQAGLGGGSSDAAAVFKVLAKMFRKEIGAERSWEPRLRLSAARLGADVPFFLKGGCAKATGIGENIAPLARRPRFWALVFKPEVGLSTREVYGWYDQEISLRGGGFKHSGLTYRSNLNKIYRQISEKQPVETWSRHLYNAFEEVVFAKVPELARIKKALIERGAMNALLSGSGSALYGIVGSRAQGEALAGKLGNFKGRVWVVRSI